jgi:P-type E1-E2 ATPase
VEIPIEEIVPGDLVALSAGDMIPADLRLLSAKDMFINQSTLTGEAMSVEKFPAAAGGSAEDPFDLSNICFMGSNVVRTVVTISSFFIGYSLIAGPQMCKRGSCRHAKYQKCHLVCRNLILPAA